MKVKYINQFLFNKAEYNVFDKEGTPVNLIIDYRNNQFDIKGIEKSKDNKFKEEVKNIAKDLLSRKHGKNFAEK